MVITKPQRKLLIARIRSNPKLKELRKANREMFDRINEQDGEKSACEERVSKSE